jgi:hypothetical protein
MISVKLTCFRVSSAPARTPKDPKTIPVGTQNTLYSSDRSVVARLGCVSVCCRYHQSVCYRYHQLGASSSRLFNALTLVFKQLEVKHWPRCIAYYHSTTFATASIQAHRQKIAWSSDPPTLQLLSSASASSNGSRFGALALWNFGDNFPNFSARHQRWRSHGSRRILCLRFRRIHLVDNS